MILAVCGDWKRLLPVLMLTLVMVRQFWGGCLDGLSWGSRLGRYRNCHRKEHVGKPDVCELAYAKEPGDPFSDPIDSLPLTARLERLFAADLPDLPEQTRRALLLAAPSGTDRLSDVLHAAPGLDRPPAAPSAGPRRDAPGMTSLRV
ncbi:hypothetical protein AB0A76_24455 [Streptomyces exfoliatus]|uniref:Uncharacterized protein n=1 Tax=Streptomyces exfoliatus TaxID=1905 RepID=A0ABV3D1G8_STREX